VNTGIVWKNCENFMTFYMVTIYIILIVITAQIGKCYFMFRIAIPINSRYSDTLSLRRGLRENSWVLGDDALHPGVVREELGRHLGGDGREGAEQLNGGWVRHGAAARTSDGAQRDPRREL